MEDQNICALQTKHMATVLAKLRRLESLVTDITGVNPLSLLCFVPLVLCDIDPIQQQHEFPHKPALDTCRTRCQQMSTLLHVLLKADPLLEGDVADGKTGSSVCHQLGQVSVLHYF